MPNIVTHLHLALSFRKRTEPCGFEWTARHWVRMRGALSSTPGEWSERDETCILAKGHAGQHQSQSGIRHD